MKVFVIFACAFAYASASVLHDIIDVGITRGHNASLGQFPYHVGLKIHIEDTILMCGGSLISNTWVLTAAHCTYKADFVTLYLGSNRRSSPLVEHSVSQKDIINHEKFTNISLVNDIALIRIPYVEYSRLILPIKLPKYELHPNTYDGHTSVATGWGATMDPKNPYPDILQYTKLKIISHNDCYASWGRGVTTSNICVATPNGSSICYGDSGGPLVEYPSWVQVGVTSFVSGKGCDKGVPAVFTRITDFIGWIKQHTQLPL